jgi:hypothetical protein
VTERKLLLILRKKYAAEVHLETSLRTPIYLRLTYSRIGRKVASCDALTRQNTTRMIHAIPLSCPEYIALGATVPVAVFIRTQVADRFRFRNCVRFADPSP